MYLSQTSSRQLVNKTRPFYNFDLWSRIFEQKYEISLKNESICLTDSDQLFHSQHVVGYINATSVLFLFRFITYFVNK